VRFVGSLQIGVEDSDVMVPNRVGRDVFVDLFPDDLLV